GLYDRGSDRWTCRRRARPDDRKRLARIDQLSAFGRRAGHAGAGRCGPSLRRTRGCHHFHGCTRSVFRHSATILVLLDRRASDNGRHGCSEWHCRRAITYLRAMEAEMSAPSLAKKDAATDRAIALATRGLTKSFGSLPVARNIEISLPV